MEICFLLPDGETDDAKAIVDSLGVFWGSVASCPTSTPFEDQEGAALVEEIARHFRPPIGSACAFKERLNGFLTLLLVQTACDIHIYVVLGLVCMSS